MRSDLGLNDKHSWQIIIEFAYLIIMLPMFFCMYNAVPASDDFAFGSRTISDNILLDAIGYSAWNWQYHSGRWLTFFFQKLINPLNANVHLGRIYGIWMICIFILVYALVRYSLNVIYRKLVPTEKINVRVLTFITIAVLYTTYYYVEAYNWYIGATAYAVPFALLMLTVAYAIRFEDTEDIKYYIGMIISGLIPATNEFLDVAIGVSYVYVVFRLYKDNLKNKNKIATRLIPLAIYILCGISVVFAPGNFVRQDGYDVQPNIVAAVCQICIDLVIRLKDILVYHPVAVISFVVLFILGIKSEIKSNIQDVLIVLLLTIIIIFGTIFPYVYGRAMTTTYLDVRMQYLVDYVLLIGMCILSFRLGMFANGVDIWKTSTTVRVGLIVTIGVYIVFTASYGEAYKNIVPLDIISNRGLIEESYQFWNGVITEIENSNEDDVIISREKEPMWTPYFLYMGMVDDEVYDSKSEEIYANGKIMPNVYYKKNTISIKYLRD